MEAFYVSIIFLGSLLVIGSLFFIAMDKVSGKDFFKEFDRKKEEMFNLIQDSEEMVQELNRMSDYVVSVVSEKNQEFFNKSANVILHETVETAINIDNDSVVVQKVLESQVQEATIIPSVQDIKQCEVPMDTMSQYKELELELEPEASRAVNTQFSYNSELYNKDTLDIGKSRLVLNNRRREVLLMIEQGLSNDEISEKLKIGKGEIGLIRGLSR